MPKYVEAANEFEAEEKALRQLRNMNCVPIADFVEVTPLEDEEEDEEEAYLKAEREGMQMY